MNFGLSGFYNGIVPNCVLWTLLFLCSVRRSTAHAGDDAYVVALADVGGNYSTVRLSRSSLLVALRAHELGRRFQYSFCFSRFALMHLSGRALNSGTNSASTFPASLRPALPQNAPARKARIENPSASAWSLSVSKRLLDLSVALVALAFLALPMLAIAVCVRLSSKGPALFSQLRVGRGGRHFWIYKFRSMTCGAEQSGPHLTRDGDQRITGLGHWLRKLKLDELPQFYNVLRGEMSLVGPRPKLPKYAAIVNMPYRPGITGAATLAFRDEESILSHIHPSQLDDFYRLHIQPMKVRLDARYMCRATLWSDLRLIGATFLACFRTTRTSYVFRNASARILTTPVQPAKTNRTVNSFETAG
jgi:lipopolysaccharide/colanic/teichoic acid biosynthesis glycosyltransferase